MKIPTRSFLTDFGLVGASVFILACLAQPKTETWVATVQREDGTVSSFQVDHETRYKGQSEIEVRHSILQKLVPPENEKRGLVRWQSETALFYAQADSQKLDSPPKNSVFQTASFRDENAAESEGKDPAKNWVAFWQGRSDQSAVWLNKHSEFQKEQISRISQSLAVARVEKFLPDHEGLLISAATAFLVLIIGMLWCVWIPRRTIAGQNIINALGTSSALVSDDAVALSPTDSMTEPAAMSFRSTWVRLRQPPAVHARRVCGWAIVTTGMLAICRCFL